MADQVKIVDLHTLRFKSTSLSSRAETTPPPALATATSLLKTVAGVQGLYLGRQLEDDDLTSWALAATWESHAAADGFYTSETFMPFRAALRSAVDGGSGAGEGWSTRRVSLRGRDGREADQEVALALGAPCTEVFTAFGVPDTYYDAVAKFLHAIQPTDAGADADANADANADAESVPPVPGLQDGGAYGRVGGSTVRTAEGKEEPNAVVLVLGWDRQQSHYDAKAIPDSVLTREVGNHLQGANSAEVYHVNFKKL